MTALEHLNDLVTPLTADDLEATSGGLVPLALLGMYVAGFGAGFAGAALWDLYGG